MQINTVVNNIKTVLDGWSWATPDAGTMSLSEIFTTEYYTTSESYPFAYVIDEGGQGQALDFSSIEFVTRISVFIGVNTENIDESDESLRLQVADKRLRVTWDYAKTQIFSDAFRASCGMDYAFEPTYERLDLDELNIKGYKINFGIKEIIQRG